MLKKIEIKNFKSIYDESIELGRVNVFIGENGCGKTNVLEAVGMASAAAYGNLSNDELALKGIRVTKPSITFSSFKSLAQKSTINLKCIFFEKEKSNNIIEYRLTSPDPSNISSFWHKEKKIKESQSEQNGSGIKLSNEEINEIKKTLAKKINNEGFLSNYKIFHLSTDKLRGIGGTSHAIPGLNGENLDYLIANFSKEEYQELIEHSYFISWLDEILIDKEGILKLQGHNLNLGQSKLYFKDQFMQKKNNVFSAENANEGVLHILFYLALFISKRTPELFAIDNIETALNPQLCRDLIIALTKLASRNKKQVLITTHNPAILDGLNLHDDDQRLFVVSRNFKGHTRIERLKIKPDAEVGGRRLKLSELWMRNYLGAIPQHY